MTREGQARGIPEPRASGGNRAALEEASQIVREMFDRRIAIVGCQSQRFGCDGVEIARKCRNAQWLGRVLAGARQLSAAKRFEHVDQRRPCTGRRRGTADTPVSNSCSNTPSEYTSVSVEIVAPRICSGAAYRGVSATALHARERGIRRLALAQQLGDAEIQQLHLAFGIHEDVGGLEVPVHHQVLVRVFHGGEHLEEKSQPRREVELLALAIVRAASHRRHIRAR